MTHHKGSVNIKVVIIKARELQVLWYPRGSAWVGPVESELQKTNIFEYKYAPHNIWDIFRLKTKQPTNQPTKQHCFSVSWM